MKPRQNVKQGQKDVESPVFGGSSADLSSIEKDSIFQVDQSSDDGNPLHSTALESTVLVDDSRPTRTRQKILPEGKQISPDRANTPYRKAGTGRRPSAPGQKSVDNVKGKRGKGVEKRPHSSGFRLPLVPTSATNDGKYMRKISEESETSRTRVSASSASQLPTEMELTNRSSAPISPVRKKSQPVFPSREEAGEGTSTQPLWKARGPRKPPGPAAQQRRRVSSGRVQFRKISEASESLTTSESSSSVSQVPAVAEEEAMEDSPASEVESEEPVIRRRSSTSAERRKSQPVFPSGDEAPEGPSTKRPGGGKKRARKSTSSLSDTGAKSRGDKMALRNPIDLEVILLHFLDFVERYKETVESSAVEKAIDYMSESFVEQMTEAITAAKNLNSVKKKNMKLNTAINRKRSSLFDAKNELLESEAKMRALQREHRELQQRLTDMTNGMTLVRDLTDLHTKYAAHCDTHPDQPPVYGPTSLPALLLEARCMMGAEHQLKAINEKLQKVLDDVNQE